MYQANENRYGRMIYHRSGRAGLKLPALSLGLWHNFGDGSNYGNMKDIVLTSFDFGITHFDLANNYGPPAGSAEENFGKMLATDLKPYRDELVIATKAGYGMWDGPYGDWGSKKYLVASLDQSLKRLGLDYVDIFYHHRMDPQTPLWETMDALAGRTFGKGTLCWFIQLQPGETEGGSSFAEGNGCALPDSSAQILHAGKRKRESVTDH